MKTDNKSIRIGTGNFLAQPPQEMAAAEFGYLGSQSQWATLVTENGTFFVDSRQGRVYLLTSEKATDLSNQGMRNFFENNLSLEIENQYKRLTGDEFPLSDCPHHPEGSGFMATYDSRHTRYILTKKSYKCVDEDALLNGYREINNLSGYNPNAPSLYLKQYGTEDRGYKRWRYKADSSSGEVNGWQNGAGFENKYWTISWNISLGGWASFHSYRPNVYITMKNSFFSKLNRFDTGANSVYLYRHGMAPDGQNYNEFFGELQPFVIDFIATQNAIQTFEYNNIHWVSHASTYNSATNTYVDQRYITIDKVLFYNSYQCSGYINLINKDFNPTSQTTNSVFDNTLLGESLITRKERTWSMNGFRDMVIDRSQPMFTKDWANSDYRMAYSDGLDYAVNSNAIATKAWFDASRFRDKYLGIRVIFSNFVGADNSKLIFNYLYTQQTFSPR